MNSSITLFLPALTKALTTSELKQFKHLTWILRRSRKVASDFSETEDLLNNFLGSTLPFANICAMDLGVFDVSKTWFIAQPIQLFLDREHAFLKQVFSDTLLPDEITALTTLLKDNLQHYDGDVFFDSKRNCWLIALPHAASSYRTARVNFVLHKDILAFLPKAGMLPQLITELQMELYNHPFNQTRASQQKPTINSIWFWGNAENSTINSSNFDLIISDDFDINRLAEALSMKVISPKDFHFNHDAAQILYINLTFESDNRLELFSDVDKTLIKNIIKLFKQKKIQTIHVCFDHQNTFILTRSAYQRFRFCQPALEEILHD